MSVEARAIEGDIAGIKVAGTGRVVAVVLGLWLCVVVFASAEGTLTNAGVYAPGVAAFVTMLIPLFASLVWRDLRLWIVSVGVRRLTAIHVLRAMATPLFLWYGSRGLLPQVFAQRAGWGDLISAVAALVAVTVWRKPAVYFLVQIVGLIDFVTAFRTAFALAGHDPSAMLAVTRLPMALIPFFFVGILASTQVMVLVLLGRGRSGFDAGL